MGRKAERAKNYVVQLKAAAKAIYDNADKMIGGYSQQTGDLDITITINEQEVPQIIVRQELYPDCVTNLYK